VIRPGDLYQSKKTGIIWSVKTMGQVGPTLKHVEDPESHVRPPWQALKQDFVKIGYLFVMDVYNHLKGMFNGSDGYCDKIEAMATMCVVDTRFLKAVRMNLSKVTWDDFKSQLEDYVADPVKRCRLYRVFRYVEHFRVHYYYDVRDYDGHTKHVLVNGKVVGEVTALHDGVFTAVPFRKTFNSVATWERNHKKADDAFEAFRFVADCAYAALPQLR